MIDFSSAPDDPILRISWLGGVMKRAKAELDVEYEKAYGEARLSGRMDAALDLGLHSTKRALRYTRAWNQKMGRQIRWGDKR